MSTYDKRILMHIRVELHKNFHLIYYFFPSVLFEFFDNSNTSAEPLDLKLSKFHCLNNPSIKTKKSIKISKKNLFSWLNLITKILRITYLCKLVMFTFFRLFSFVQAVPVMNSSNSAAGQPFTGPFYLRISKLKCIRVWIQNWYGGTLMSKTFLIESLY